MTRLLEPDEAEALARRIVALSSADETEVTVDSVADAFVRFADSGPTQNADRERVDVAVRVRLATPDGWREARATCCGTDEAAHRGAIERALALARVSPPNAELPELGGPVDVPASAGDPAVLRHGFEAKARWAKRAIDACVAEDLRPAGLVQTTARSRAIVSSAGRAVRGGASRAGFALTATAPSGGAGIGSGVAARIDALDAERVVERAVTKAAASRDPQPIEPGEYTVVLEPLALSSILLFASYHGFGAREVEERSSFLCGRMDEELFPKSLRLCDDATNALYPGLPFDAEGSPKRSVALIAEGRFGAPVTDRLYAKKLGVECTGHALPQPNTHGPQAQNLVLDPGDAATGALLAGVERGLLVTQFHYTNVIDPREMLLTGMTRNGTFLIENGEIAGPVRNLRFTDSLLNALARISSIGREREVAGALFDGEAVLPAVRIDGFRFTSTTDF